MIFNHNVHINNHMPFTYIDSAIDISIKLRFEQASPTLSSLNVTAQGETLIWDYFLSKDTGFIFLLTSYHFISDVMINTTQPLYRNICDKGAAGNRGILPALGRTGCRVQRK